MRLTPAQVKNLMRRGLRFLVDPEPEKQDKQRVRDFFNSQCAYCGVKIVDGEGDIDHLVSAALGGANALANRILSCKDCNAKEKRDRDWIEFLREKSPTDEVFHQRKTKIEQWVRLNGDHPKLDEQVLTLLQEECERTTKEYDRACARVRSTTSGPT